jgi:hypothetical protein
MGENCLAKNGVAVSEQEGISKRQLVQVASPVPTGRRPSSANDKSVPRLVASCSTAHFSRNVV